MKKLNYLIEVCAVSIDDILEGSSLVVFIVSNKDLKYSYSDIENILFDNFGSFAIPKEIIQVKNHLPLVLLQ